MTPLESKSIAYIKSVLDIIHLHKIHQELKDDIKDLDISSISKDGILSRCKTIINQQNTYITEALSWINSLLESSKQ